MLAILVSGCDLTSPDGKLGLTVSNYDESEDLCTEGIQATLTILNDDTIISSPRSLPGDSFRELSRDQYSTNTRVRIEARCFDNGTEGFIIAEGTAARPSKTGGLDRYLDVSRGENNEEVPFSENCLVPAEKQSRTVDVKVLDSSEPLPCISVFNFLGTAK